MPDYLTALIVGAIFGMLCKWLGLPIPAPAALAGLMGIIGIYVGYSLL